MLNLFGPARYLIRISKVNIDNNIFKLHYKVTVVLLITFSLMVTAKQYIGDPIYCTSSRASPAVVNSFCWIYATLTDANTNGEIGKTMIQPGVGHRTKDHEPEWIHHKYYQWVCFVLFIQAVCFYVPHYLWKIWEGGLIQRLSRNLESITLNKDDQLNQIQLIIEHLSSSFRGHECYAFKFALCEMMNFINVIGQIFLTDVFLNGKFKFYGWEVANYYPMDSDSIDPMSHVFPKMTKCIYYDYGASGTIQKMDSICILPLNVVNDKIYIVLWFWFLALAFISLFSLIYRLTVLFVKPFRFILLCARSRCSLQGKVKRVAAHCSFGDWFLLNQLAKNIDPEIFDHIINELDKVNIKNMA